MKDIPEEILDVAESIMSKTMTARDSVIEEIIAMNDLLKLESKVDEQTWDLAVEVYQKLEDALELKGGQREALTRLRDSIFSRSQPSLHRNNIFKAANALGIKLPSGSF